MGNLIIPNSDISSSGGIVEIEEPKCESFVGGYQEISIFNDLNCGIGIDLKPKAKMGGANKNYEKQRNEEDGPLRKKRIHGSFHWGIETIKS